MSPFASRAGIGFASIDVERMATRLFRKIGYIVMILLAFLADPEVKASSASVQLDEHGFCISGLRKLWKTMKDRPHSGIPARSPGQPNYSDHVGWTIDRNIRRVFQLASKNAGFSDFFPRNDRGYFYFAKSIGIQSRGLNNSRVDIQRVREMYEEHFGPLLKSGVIREEDIIYPGLLLTNDGGKTLLVQKPWDPIPAGYVITEEGFVEDSVERLLNAHGFFTFDAGDFAAHDLLGHISSYFENPRWMARIRQIAKILVSSFAGHAVFENSRLKVTTDLNGKDIDLIQAGRFALFSEAMVTVTPGGKEKFRQISWLASDPTDPIEAIGARMRDSDSDDLVEHARALLDFYERNIRLLGGLARDRIILSEIDDDDDSFNREEATLPALVGFVKAAIADESVDRIEEGIAELELALDFWTSFTPDEFLDSVLSSTPATRRILEKAKKNRVALSLEDSGDAEFYWFDQISTPAGRAEFKDYFKRAAHSSLTTGATLLSKMNSPLLLEIADEVLFEEYQRTYSSSSSSQIGNLESLLTIISMAKGHLSRTDPLIEREFDRLRPDFKYSNAKSLLVQILSGNRFTSDHEWMRRVHLAVENVARQTPYRDLDHFWLSFKSTSAREAALTAVNTRLDELMSTGMSENIRDWKFGVAVRQLADEPEFESRKEALLNALSRAGG